MSETKNPQDYAAFLESLKVNNEGPEEMHGWRFDEPITSLLNGLVNDPTYTNRIRMLEHCEYLIERLRRAESNAKPSDLAEQVKSFIRAGMDAQLSYCNDKEMPSDSMSQKARNICEQYLEFRRLSEPGES